jgi:hypothetical protein
MRYLGCDWSAFESMPKWVVDRAIVRAKEEHAKREADAQYEALKRRHGNRGRHGTM